MPFISDLDAAIPADTEGASLGASRIRNIISAIKASFTGVTGAVTLTHTQLNDAALKGGDNTFSGINTFSGTIAGATPFIFEGVTPDAFETSFALDDPTADRTITLPDKTGSVMVTPTIQTFTATGTWTKPVGCKNIRVRLVGSGAGGGAGNNVNGTGPGGGGGGFSEKWIDVSAISSVSITISAAGVGGAPVNGLGTDGGSTSFGAHCSATGGKAATGTATNQGGGPGVGSGGNINAGGGSGGDGNNANTLGGHGGHSLLGFAGQGGNGAGTGTAGLNGGGGAGGGAGGSGGAGGTGFVIVEEF
jgi:hypothetical protein